MEGERKRKGEGNREVFHYWAYSTLLSWNISLELHGISQCSLFFYVIPSSEAQISLVKMILEIVPDSCHLKT